MSTLNEKQQSVLRKAAAAIKDRGYEGDARLADSVLGILKWHSATQAPSAPVARQPLENIEQLDERAAFETQMRAMGADEFTLRKWVALTDAGPTYRNQIVQDHWRVWQARASLSVKAGATLDIEGIAKRVYDEADQGLSYDEYAQGKKAGIEALERALLAAAPTPPTTGEA